jgi:NADH-quinone oxidoreductase subunit L
VVLIIGATTALLAASMGSVQHDIKKVLAYSTISQLGFMFMGLGTGNVSAGMFHLFTHAFFKSLLFLGAGSIIHSLHTQDMREMGGVGKSMKVTTVTFTVGTLALSGIMPFSGFFSKDLILDHLWREGHYVIYSVALASAFLTAFYMARLWFRVFSGTPRKAGHAHESDMKILSPMIVLALLSVLAGATTLVFGEFLGSETEWPSLVMGGASTIVALSGIGLGWALFGNGRDPEAVRARASKVYMIVTNRFFLDLVAEQYIAGGYNRLSEKVNWFDKKVINGIVNGVGVACRQAGTQLRRLQAGRVQVYQRLVVAAVLVLVLVAVLATGV